jgi:FkbM family methyltransferase
MKVGPFTINRTPSPKAGSRLGKRAGATSDTMNLEPTMPVTTSPAPSRRAYERYVHSIKAAYRSLNLADRASNEALFITPLEALNGLSRDEQLRVVVQAMKRRLTSIDPKLSQQIYDLPRFRKMSLHNRDAFIPIVNDEGRDWYEATPLLNFDFFVESFCGMHNGAEVVYDIGGHQGVWALYYALGVGPNGRVYTFEPSIVNVETIALSFLLNDMANVIIVPFGIGETNETIRPDANGLLIAGVEHNVNIIRLDNIFWEKPDFVKIDIEGYEHELLRSLPDLFEFSTNMHLEIHVPHLDRRNIDYREIYRLIPFDKVRVRLSRGGQVTDVGPDDVLSDYCTLLITPKGAA